MEGWSIGVMGTVNSLTQYFVSTPTLQRSVLFPLFYDQGRVPGVPVLRQQLVSRDGSPCSGRIKFPIRERLVIPSLPNIIHNLPCRLHFIAPDKKRRIADHRFEQQPFISLRRISSKLRVIAEVHPYRPYCQAGPRHFAVESK